MATVTRPPRATSEAVMCAPAPADPQSTARMLRRVVAVICGVWAAIVVLWPHTPFTLTFDDAFYYFHIARNIAAGHGSTFDGINTTNGYHPLWMAICTIPYYLGLDGLAAVRALLVAQLVAWFAVLWMVAGVVGRSVDGWRRLDGADANTRRNADRLLAVAMVLVAANPFVLKLFVNGLESGVTALFTTALLVIAVRQHGQLLDGSTRQRLLIGGLLAGALLGRTDGVLLAAVIGVWCLPEARAIGRAGFRALVELAAIPAVTLAAYLASNVALTGHIDQVSGAVKRLPMTPGRMLTFAIVLAVAALVGRAAQRAGRRTSKLPRVVAWFKATGWFAAFCVVIVGYYVVLQAVPYLWYFSPLALYALVTILLVVADLAEGAVLEAAVGKSPTRALVPVAAILVIPLLLGFGMQTQTFLDPHLRSLQESDRTMGEWISKNLPANARVASFDAGVLAYFADRPVVNLDGVVNSFEWLDALHHRHTASFLRAEHVTYLANHGGSVNGNDPGMRSAADQLLGKGAGARLKLVWHKEFKFSGNLDGARTQGGTKQMGVFIYEVPTG